MELSEFLVKAKTNTYATDGEGGEKVLEDNCRELVYEEAGYKYRDRYYNFNPFIGEELVWKDGKLIWGMNYYGKVVSEEVSAKIYEFLKSALRLVKEDMPFRGLDGHKEGDLEYKNECKGNIEEFNGIEKIFYKGKEVYRLHYHGCKL